MLSPKGYLLESAYLLYPTKKCPLARDKREMVYKMFEKYEVMKAEKNDFDQCDYVFYVIKQVIFSLPLPPPPLFFFFVNSLF